MNKIIVPTGYMGSGSSAVTDLLNEYSNCTCPLDNFEFVFLHCPNGVFDLIDNLIYNNNALKSNEDLKKFYKQMLNLYKNKHWWVANYEKVFGIKFVELTNEYLESLIDCQYKGFWYVDEELNCKNYILSIFRKPFKIIFKNIKFKKLLKSDGNLRICLKSEEEIYKKTNEYINKIINLLSNDNKNIILDQLLLPHNLYRVDNIFNDNLKVIVVERDPRDIFILNKYIWREKECDIPIPLEADVFCEFYKKMRQVEKKWDSKKVMRIHFEDLIYDYDKAKTKIENFIGLKESEHKKIKKFLDPEVSIKNTQVFRNEKYKKEVSIIEKNLSEYLYEFPYVLENSISETVEFFEVDRSGFDDKS